LEKVIGKDNYLGAVKETAILKYQQDVLQQNLDKYYSSLKAAEEGYEQAKKDHTYAKAALEKAEEDATSWLDWIKSDEDKKKIKEAQDNLQAAEDRVVEAQKNLKEAREKIKTIDDIGDLESIARERLDIALIELRELKGGSSEYKRKDAEVEGLRKQLNSVLEKKKDLADRLTPKTGLEFYEKEIAKWTQVINDKDSELADARQTLAKLERGEDEQAIKAQKESIARLELEKETAINEINKLEDKKIAGLESKLESLDNKEGPPAQKLKAEIEKAKKSKAVLKAMVNIKDPSYQRSQEIAYDLTWKLADAVLQEFAYPLVDEYCAEDWEASEPAEDEPDDVHSGGPGTGGPGAGVQPPTDGGSGFPGAGSPGASTCPSGSCVKTAQLRVEGDQYKISYTVKACDNMIHYVIFLKSSSRPDYAIDDGFAAPGQSVSDNIELTLPPLAYSHVCIESEGEERCFPKV
jgi:hypothetical protein